jgi:serine/threonine protein kinase
MFMDEFIINGLNKHVERLNFEKYTNKVEIGHGTTANVYKLTGSNVMPICKKTYLDTVIPDDVNYEYNMGMFCNKISSKYTLFVDTYQRAFVGGNQITRFLRKYVMYPGKSISPFIEYFKEGRCECDHYTMRSDELEAKIYDFNKNNVIFRDRIGNAINTTQLQDVLALLCCSVKDGNIPAFKFLFNHLVRSLLVSQPLLDKLALSNSDLVDLLTKHKWLKPKFNLKTQRTLLIKEPHLSTQQESQYTTQQQESQHVERVMSSPDLYMQFFPTNIAVNSESKWTTKDGTPLTNKEVYEVMFQVAYVLAKEHEVFQHNDIKHENILIYKLGKPVSFSFDGFVFSTACIAKLIDYGIVNKNSKPTNTDVNAIYRILSELPNKSIDEGEIMEGNMSRTPAETWPPLLAHLKTKLTRASTDKVIVCDGIRDVQIQNKASFGGKSRKKKRSFKKSKASLKTKR